MQWGVTNNSNVFCCIQESIATFTKSWDIKEQIFKDCINLSVTFSSTPFSNQDQETSDLFITVKRIPYISIHRKQFGVKFLKQNELSFFSQSYENNARYKSICRHHTYWDIQWAELLVSCQSIRMETRTLIRLLTLGVFISLCIIAFCPAEVEGTLITLIALCMLFIISLKNMTYSLPVKGWKIYGWSAGIDLNRAIPAVTPNFRIFDLFWGTTPLSLFFHKWRAMSRILTRNLVWERVLTKKCSSIILFMKSYCYFLLSFIIIFLAITAKLLLCFALLKQIL